MSEVLGLFDHVLRLAMEYWRASDAPAEDKPPEVLWERGDVVPIRYFVDAAGECWICLRRDGRVVWCQEDLDDQDFPQGNYNIAIGYLVMRFPVASAFLRPSSDVMVCEICHGLGRSRDELCWCGGLGWRERTR